MRSETRKLAPLERVRLRVFYAGLDLALVPRHRRLRRQERGAVMLAEGTQLRIELGIEPIGLEHRGLQVVRDQARGDAAEEAKRVLHTANQGLGVLAPDDLAVALARVAEHGAKQMRPAPPALVVFDPGAGAEVDLQLVTGFALHPAERQLKGPGEPTHELFDRTVAATKAVFADQILIDPLCRQPSLYAGLDLGDERGAQALGSGTRAEGGVRGWFCVDWRRAAEGGVGGCICRRTPVGAEGGVTGWI